jgi:hypothetical protein
LRHIDGAWVSRRSAARQRTPFGSVRAIAAHHGLAGIDTTVCAGIDTTRDRKSSNSPTACALAIEFLRIDPRISRPILAAAPFAEMNAD